ncbi:hypothetical protein [Kitasatospora sp. NBC_01300]|uniref:hypothetical protein n=1 Tax=Kitasatospora sp. NBC_01300 TaxID=2903574 RepID=UPI002F919557|nr:hypothetical protein OG556_40470 [Kitasatospora sp. NBC_01300]
MTERTIDLLPHQLAFDGRPVGSAHAVLCRGYGGVTELLRDLAETFVPDGSWCRVGPDVHAVRGGEAAPRLRPTARGWEADLFESAWGDRAELEGVPQEHRAAVAAYVDVRHRVVADLTTAPELRAACTAGGTVAVNSLALRRLGLLDDRLRALDALQSSLPPVERIAPWARSLLTREALDVATGRNG